MKSLRVVARLKDEGSDELEPLLCRLAQCCLDLVQGNADLARNGCELSLTFC